MKHLGDITKISGYDAPTVEVIIGGSPCQDLSIAGKRAGLDGERSGLFMEQIRIIKEMRENDRASGRTAKSIRPRFMVWENVPGAFSSNKGEDFRVVLEETARVADPTAVIPRPPKGKWTNAGAIMGNGWSIAWRVFDAQFWGVPQRRRRIALVADFGGECAPPILFERESVSGDIEESGTQGERTAADIEAGTGEASEAITFLERAGCVGGGKGILIQKDKSATLSTLNNQSVCYSLQGSMIGRADKNGPQGDGVNEDKSFTLNTTDKHAVCYGISAFDSNAMKSSNPHSGVYKADTSRTLDLNGGSPACNQGGIAVVESYALENHPADSRVKLSGEVVQTLSSRMGTGGGNTPMIISLDRAAYNQGINAQYDIGIDEEGKSQTLVSKGPNAVCIGNGQPDQLGMSEKVGALNCMHDQQAVMANAIVRRLTPLECERLQGFPSGWTDIGDWVDSKGKKHKAADSPRYKALGNSIALPSWMWVLNRLNKYCKEHTMASLFDGISGFCLIWKRLGCEPIWSSEIEEFPIAVCKRHFGDEKTREAGDIEKYL